ncbi:MAG: CRISPR-associated endoribonuclease Cas6 [Cyanobacteriota bacterium]|nr:CRISPR-associated endoribonuclease Cas6 [Cyanobacteriota bacterium]
MATPVLSPALLKAMAQSELAGLAFELRSPRPVALSPSYAKGLHAWFLHQIQDYDPALSRDLHDSQTEKSFTLSRLDGPLGGDEQSLHLLPDTPYYWRLTLLTRQTVQGCLPWLRRLPATLTLAGHSFSIEGVEPFLPPATYRQLYERPGAGSVDLSFLSPTSFRRRGHHFPLPVPFNLFHSYLRRWNAFAGEAVAEAPFLDWVESSARIDRHWLESAVVPGGKRGNVTGFVGSITLSLSPEGSQHSDFRRLFYALTRLAPYCGTGHKTPFGLGQTCLGWREPAHSCFASAQSALLEQTLAQRIEVLTRQLLAGKKRTGGARALKICRTQAVILARRERGESLQAIAEDLEMGYETVKTYLKRARKNLPPHNEL